MANRSYSAPRRSSLGFRRSRASSNKPFVRGWPTLNGDPKILGFPAFKAGMKPGDLIIAVDSRYYRPTEVDSLLGDSTKAKEMLGWEPKINFKNLVDEMMESDLEIAKRDLLVKNHGFKVLENNE